MRGFTMLCAGVLCAGVLAGCAATRPADEIAARFRYRVPVEMGEYESNGSDQIEVIEVWGTRPTIEIGGEYVVLGRYVLRSEDAGKVTFFLTANGWMNSGPTMDLQRSTVTRGSRSFTLQHKMEGPGTFHVTLYGAAGELADQYFVPRVALGAGTESSNSPEPSATARR